MSNYKWTQIEYYVTGHLLPKKCYRTEKKYESW